MSTSPSRQRRAPNAQRDKLHAVCKFVLGFEPYSNECVSCDREVTLIQFDTASYWLFESAGLRLSRPERQALTNCLPCATASVAGKSSFPASDFTRYPSAPVPSAASAMSQERSSLANRILDFGASSRICRAA